MFWMFRNEGLNWWWMLQQTQRKKASILFERHSTTSVEPISRAMAVSSLTQWRKGGTTLSSSIVIWPFRGTSNKHCLQILLVSSRRRQSSRKHQSADDSWFLLHRRQSTRQAQGVLLAFGSLRKRKSWVARSSWRHAFTWFVLPLSKFSIE